MASNRNASIVVAIGVAAVIGVAGYAGVQFLTDYLKYDRYNKYDFIDPTTYQAVLLTNDQLYFGSLKNISPQYLLLTDVYYIKIDEGESQLVKLGEFESYRPQDKMTINKDQVVFWENLSHDSPVMMTVLGR